MSGSSSKDEIKIALARSKMEKAKEALEEAWWCFQGSKYSAAINRLYYAMYRACLALLVFESFEGRVPFKHTAVISHINKNYVREGLMPREAGRFLHRLQTARVEGDYKDRNFSAQEREALLKEGEAVLKQIELFLEQLAVK